MGGITEKITEFIKDLLTGWITSNLDTMFTDVNTKVETIATEVGKTPQNWNSGIFSMIKNLSDNVIVPIAGMIITFVLCYELISMIMEKNNMHDTDKIQFEYVNDRTPVIEYTLDLTNKKAPEKDTPETSENQGVSTPGSHGSDATSVSNSPKTGDNTNIAIFVLALAVSAGCLGTVVTVKRKRK